MEKVVEGHRIVSNEEGVEIYVSNGEWVRFFHDQADGKIMVQAVSISHNYPRINPVALKAGLEMLLDTYQPSEPEVEVVECKKPICQDEAGFACMLEQGLDDVPPWPITPADLTGERLPGEGA